MKVKDICRVLDDFAPPALQEGYDNAGLILGDPDKEIERCLVCVDVTEQVLEEALKNECQMVISHHPVVFHGMKKITGKNYTERIIIKAIRNEMAIYASHTNLDNTDPGVNRILGEKLGLKAMKVLDPKSGVLSKLVTFCPTGHASKVRQAIFSAGGGVIGHYDQCSYNLEGTGTFRAGEGTDPYVGTVNEIHFEPETRIEVIFPSHLQRDIVAAMIAAHPYEEVAYDIYPLANENPWVGAGMVGEMEPAMAEEEFLGHAKKRLNAPIIRHSALLGRPVKKVAICGGSGSFLVQKAISAGADIMITGDMKYHQFFDADGKILLADVGHYETEQFTKELLADHLKKKFPTFAVLISKVTTNPIHYL